MRYAGLTEDRRTEIGALAMRQRRRYKQVKKLNLEVPNDYVRIHSIRLFPQAIQDELVKYPEIVENDSSYEDDQQVLKRYKRDPLKYIIGNDRLKQTEIENGGEPWRLQRIKKERGEFKI